MGCHHELLRTVGDEVYCQKCGAHLTLEFLAAKNGTETPPEPSEEKKTRKSSRKSKTA